MNLAYTPAQQAFRAEVRAWMEANVPRHKLQTLEGAAGYAEHVEWERKLASGRWGMVTWPEEYGGRGCNLVEWLIFEEEYYRAGAPLRANQNGIFLLGPTLMEFGSPEQKARYLPPMAAGEEIWAQAWSEPQAGSDMAAIRATATREGDEYVLRGHKIWSSRATFADWAFGIFRTDLASDKHKGLSFILVPLRHPGVRVRGIPQMHGQPGFAEIFFEEARVPVANRLGAEGQGWNIAMATAGFERGLMLRSPARFQATARRLVQLYRENAERADGTVRAAVAKAWLHAEAYTLNTYATATRLMAGGHIGAEASLNKIFWSELDLSMHAAAMSLLGARAELLPHAPAAAAVGDWLEGWIFAHAGPIYAGTNEIQRNIIAERVLGMPR
ncbi:MAG: acyl-CoA dehydrogenase family protein [Gammaproteobacteria bacterium]